MGTYTAKPFCLKILLSCRASNSSSLIASIPNGSRKVNLTGGTRDMYHRIKIPPRTHTFIIDRCRPAAQRRDFHQTKSFLFLSTTSISTRWECFFTISKSTSFEIANTRPVASCCNVGVGSQYLIYSQNPQLFCITPNVLISNLISQYNRKI